MHQVAQCRPFEAFYRDYGFTAIFKLSSLTMRKKNKRYLLIILIFLIGPTYVLLSGKLVLNQHWRTADRSSANIAPQVSINTPIVTIYAARAYGLRGMFAVHIWIALKPANSKQYTVYQCLGWNLFRNRPVIVITHDIPDRLWYGNKPWILRNLTGKQAANAIKEIKQAVANYPYKHNYLMWPGPNSNSFIAYILRHSPSIKLALPTTAIGKDFFPGLCTNTPSNSGYQCSLKGVIGFAIGKKEGLEVNLLGLNLAINTAFPYLHLPGVG